METPDLAAFRAEGAEAVTEHLEQYSQMVAPINNALPSRAAGAGGVLSMLEADDDDEELKFPGIPAASDGYGTASATASSVYNHQEYPAPNNFASTFQNHDEKGHVKVYTGPLSVENSESQHVRGETYSHEEEYSRRRQSSAPRGGHRQHETWGHRHETWSSNNNSNSNYLERKNRRAHSRSPIRRRRKRSSSPRRREREKRSRTTAAYPRGGSRRDNRANTMRNKRRQSRSISPLPARKISSTDRHYHKNTASETRRWRERKSSDNNSSYRRDKDQRLRGRDRDVRGLYRENKYNQLSRSERQPQRQQRQQLNDVENNSSSHHLDGSPPQPPHILDRNKGGRRGEMINREEQLNPKSSQESTKYQKRRSESRYGEPNRRRESFSSNNMERRRVFDEDFVGKSGSSQRESSKAEKQQQQLVDSRPRLALDDDDGLGGDDVGNKRHNERRRPRKDSGNESRSVGIDDDTRKDYVTCSSSNKKNTGDTEDNLGTSDSNIQVSSGESSKSHNSAKWQERQQEKQKQKQRKYRRDTKGGNNNEGDNDASINHTDRNPKDDDDNNFQHRSSSSRSGSTRDVNNIRGSYQSYSRRDHSQQETKATRGSSTSNSSRRRAHDSNHSTYRSFESVIDTRRMEGTRRLTEENDYSLRRRRRDRRRDDVILSRRRGLGGGNRERRYGRDDLDFHSKNRDYSTNAAASTSGGSNKNDLRASVRNNHRYGGGGGLGRFRIETRLNEEEGEKKKKVEEEDDATTTATSTRKAVSDRGRQRRQHKGVEEQHSEERKHSPTRREEQRDAISTGTGGGERSSGEKTRHVAKKRRLIIQKRGYGFKSTTGAASSREQRREQYEQERRLKELKDDDMEQFVNSRMYALDDGPLKIQRTIERRNFVVQRADKERFGKAETDQFDRQLEEESAIKNKEKEKEQVESQDNLRKNSKRKSLKIDREYGFQRVRANTNTARVTNVTGDRDPAYEQQKLKAEEQDCIGTDDTILATQSETADPLIDRRTIAENTSSNRRTTRYKWVKKRVRLPKARPQNLTKKVIRVIKRKRARINEDLDPQENFRITINR